jgi:hypothetical protein
MRFAYADPPYFGYSKKFYSDHPAASVYDSIEGHAELISNLSKNYPDGWALSMTSGNLFDILPLCPPGCRVAAWVKPWASFKPGVCPAYAWEPVVFTGGRKPSRSEPSGRDFVSCGITLKRGFTGAKPEQFVHWVLNDLFHATLDDEVVDLFPGSGAVQRAMDSWRLSRGLPLGVHTP